MSVSCEDSCNVSDKSAEGWPTKRIVMAIDVETSGPSKWYDLIGIGASVLNERFEELDSLNMGSYIKPDHEPTNDALDDATEFEPHCWDEFWSKHPEALAALEYTGPLSKEDRHGEMAEQLQSFRTKWEGRAAAVGAEYNLVSDNSVFDGSWCNHIIMEHTSDLPIPYSATKHKKTKRQAYSSFLETHSQQRGFLMAVDPDFRGIWGLSERIAELYDVPKPMRKHDHSPANDAYTIAYDQMVLFGIMEGVIKPREQ